MVAVDRMVRAEMRHIAETMHRPEVAHLVKTYYQVQEFRKAAMNMVRAQTSDGRPHEIVQWVGESQKGVEEEIKGFLKSYAGSNDPGKWLLAQHGIGPVIAAGLLAHIDIHKAPTVGNIWSFAGLNPEQKWEKGQKRPWNADLKTLCFKISDSFVKTSNSSKSFYGPIYRARKEYETQKNELGEYAEAAAQVLSAKRITEPATKKTYESGKLPLGHVDMRARRYAVKFFLSHLHDVMTWFEFGVRAPKPYAFEHMGHAHLVECPMPPWAQ